MEPCVMLILTAAGHTFHALFMNMALIDKVMPVHLNCCFNNIIKL